METIAQFIGRLANKAGIAQDDPNLVNILSNADISKVTIPAELTTGIDNNLLSLSQATDNHPAVKKVYQAQALNAIDSRIAAVIKEAGLSPEKVAELEGIKSTYERFEAVAEAIKEAATQKSKPNNEDKTALQKQVEDLLSQVKSVKSDAETRIAQIQKERESDRIGFEVKNLLSGVKTIFDELPASARHAAIDSLISKALAEKEASFAFDETNSLTLKGKDDTAVVGANSTKYTPQSFIEEILASNKIIKVSEPTPTTPTQQAPRIEGTPAKSGISQQVALNNLSVLENFQKQVASA